MAFFNEFPHTRTYDSDLAWLIKRMKEVLSRMDSLEERMQALEDLVTDFINSMNLPELIKNEIIAYFNELINNGTFEEILNAIFTELISQINYVKNNSIVFPDNDLVAVRLTSSDISSIESYNRYFDNTRDTKYLTLSAEIDLHISDFGKFLGFSMFDNINHSPTSGKELLSARHVIKLNDTGYQKVNTAIRALNVTPVFNNEYKAYASILEAMCNSSYIDGVGSHFHFYSVINYGVGSTHYVALVPKLQS